MFPAKCTAKTAPPLVPYKDLATGPAGSQASQAGSCATRYRVAACYCAPVPTLAACGMRGIARRVWGLREGLAAVAMLACAIGYERLRCPEAHAVRAVVASRIAYCSHHSASKAVRAAVTTRFPTANPIASQ